MLTKEKIAEVEAKLKSMPPIIKEMTLADAVKKLAPSIRKLQDKGYSLEQITEILKDDGINITQSSLKRHLGPAKRRKAKPLPPPVVPAE